MYAIGLVHGRSVLELNELPGISNPVLSASDVTDVPAAIVADPFMLHANGSWQMFFEVLNLESGKGEIGLATSSDAMHWQYERVVLVEPFHLSYPHVMNWEGQYYMIPESAQAGSVRLYRASNFPSDWELVTELITGPCLLDATPFHYDGMWWMFVETNPEFRFDTLRLFLAPSLNGPWAEHPSSPVSVGNAHIARPAGRVQVGGEYPIRFGQNCDPVYGTDVRAFQIDELTKVTYREASVSRTPILGPGDSGWNADGMHHIDAHAVADDRWLACTDGWFWDRPAIEAD